MTGPLRLPVDMGIGHYDVPPPDRFDDLVELRDGDRFRFANHLKAFVEVVDGKVIQAGYLGGGLIGSTIIKMGTRSVTIPAVSYTDINRDPEITESGVRFVQTAGGRTGAPLPRRISRPPFVQITAPTAWTTLSLTIGVDGSSSFELLGASPFPRHWIYGEDGALALKSGVIDFAEWAAKNTHDRSPWFDHDQTSPVSEVESAAERAMSVEIMGGETPALRRYQTGDPLMTQGTPGREVLLILDGMTEISIDGEAVAEAGPGSILGERAALEGGLRTATVTATTPVRVAVTEAHELDLNDLAEVARLHRREEG
ncbi:MAG: cyclic nucleotide-binding domain-containing protein [Acidimicrobiia bacterium]